MSRVAPGKTPGATPPIDLSTPFLSYCGRAAESSAEVSAPSAKLLNSLLP